MTERKLTALTDPDNIMVVWQDAPQPPKKAAKKTGTKVLPRNKG